MSVPPFLLLLLIAASWPGQVRAGEAVLVSRAAAVDLKEAVALDGSGLETTITIENPGNEPREVALVGTPFVGLDGQGSAAAVWTLTGAAGRPLPLTIQPTTVKLEANTAYTINLTATFGVAGKYRAMLEVFEKNRLLKRFQLDVVRQPQTLDAKTLLVPAAPYLHQCGLAETLGLCGNAKITVPVALQNTTAATVELKSVGVSSVVAKHAAQDVVLSDVSASVTSPSCAAKGVMFSLAPHGECTANVELTRFPGAGDYSMKLHARGSTGGFTENSITLKVRAAWWWCAIVLALGALLGAFARGWRTQGRAVTVGLYDVARATEVLNALQVSATDARREIVDLLTHAAGLSADLHGGRQTDLTVAPAFYRRALAFEQWAKYEALFQQAGTPAQQKIQTSRDDALNAIANLATDATAIQAALTAFRNALDAAARMAKRRAFIEGLLRDYGTELEREAAASPSTPLSETATRALAALRDALRFIDGATGDAAAVEERIRTATSAIGEYEQKKSTPRIRNEAALQAPADVPVLIPPVIVPWKPNATPNEILDRIRRFDCIVNGIGVIIITCIGVQTLWAPSLAWGTLGDYLTAFAAGAGLQFGYGSAIGELRTAIASGGK
jgi:hypothetical protein